MGRDCRPRLLCAAQSLPLRHPLSAQAALRRDDTCIPGIFHLTVKGKLSVTLTHHPLCAAALRGRAPARVRLFPVTYSFVQRAFVPAPLTAPAASPCFSQPANQYIALARSIDCCPQ